MTWHDPNNGERDWRHDDDRYQVGAELSNHQQIDKHQAYRIGCPHITKSFVGNLRLTIPFQGVVSIGVLRLGNKILLNGLTIGAPQVCKFESCLGQTIKWAVVFTGHIRYNISHRH